MIFLILFLFFVFLLPSSFFFSSFFLFLLSYSVFLFSWSQILRKSIKKRSNIDEKSIKNRSKSRPEGGLGGFWLPKPDQNVSLEGVWAHYGSQARLGRRPRRFLNRPERFLWDFGANMGPTWDPRWHQVGPKIVQKSMSKSMKKLKPLEIRFGENFEGFWEAKWSQVGTKMASKIDLILKTPKIKKTFKTNEHSMILEFPGVPKSRKNLLKIE